MRLSGCVNSHISSSVATLYRIFICLDTVLLPGRHLSVNGQKDGGGRNKVYFMRLSVCVNEVGALVTRLDTAAFLAL